MYISVIFIKLSLFTLVKYFGMFVYSYLIIINHKVFKKLWIFADSFYFKLLYFKFVCSLKPYDC